MQKKYIFSILAAGLVFLFWQNRAVSSLPQVVLKFPEPALWSRDTEVGTEIVGPEHYYFTGTTDIDLNLVPIEDDLSASLKERGEAQFVKDTMRGKNTVNTMFGADESKLLSHSLKPAAGGQVLEINTSQKIDGVEFLILEKYFVYPKEAVHLALRWPKYFDAQKVTAAKAAFSRVTPQFRGTAGR
jgi:hypothetical protein